VAGGWAPGVHPADEQRVTGACSRRGAGQSEERFAVGPHPAARRRSAVDPRPRRPGETGPPRGER